MSEALALAPKFEQMVDPTVEVGHQEIISSDLAASNTLNIDAQRESAIETVTNLYTVNSAPAEKGLAERAKEKYDAFRGVLRKGAALGVGLLVMGAAVETTAGVASPAAVKKNQNAAPSTWSRLGGDPFIRGGVQTKHAFVRMITSKKGHQALRLQGLNTTEIKALDTAARKGETYTCKLKYGEDLASMVFGINGASIDRNVTFKDSRYKGTKGAPAWCLDGMVRDKNGKIIEVVKTKTPRKCANPGVDTIVVKTPPKPSAPPKKPTTTPESTAPCVGDTTNVNIGVAAQGGNCSVNTVVQVCTATNSPGAEVCTIQPPEQPVSHSPYTSLTGPQHVLVGGEVELCEVESDPDNDIVSRNFSETGNGNFIPNVYPGDELGEFCIKYKAGTTPDAATVTVKVTDSRNNTAIDSESFPIVDAGQF